MSDNRKQISACPRFAVQVEGLTLYRQKETFGANVLYLNTDGNYMLLYVCQNSSHCVFKMGVLCTPEINRTLCVNYTGIFKN